MTDDDSEITPPPSPKVSVEPQFDIEFNVPCGGVAARVKTIPSNLSYDFFRFEVAEIMGYSHVTLPALGYTTSWEAKGRTKPTIKILDGHVAYSKLIAEAREYIAEQKAKNRGKGVVKSWNINLHDLQKAEAQAKVSIDFSN
jgi:hypothetical protein